MSPDASRKLVLWILWLAFPGAVSFLCLGLAPEQRVERATNVSLVLPELAWLAIIVVPVILAAAIRVLVLPRHAEHGKVLVNMILSLALAEAPAVLTAFLEPAKAPSSYAAFIAVWLLNIPVFMRIAPSAPAGKRAAS